MKLRKIFTVISLALVLAVALCACSLFTPETETPSTKTYTVSIYYENGGYKPEDFINVKTGTLTLPKVEPTKEGYDFEGWYLDDKFVKPIKVGEKADAQISVYPKFTKKILSVKIVDTTGGKDTVVKVEYGGKADIQAPDKQGYEFEGWYLDNKFTAKFDTNKAITENVEIYAKWKYATYSISYECNGGKFSEGVEPITSYKIIDETALVGASKDNYVFDGWFTEDGKRFDTVKGLVGHVTLYAKYRCLLAEMHEIEGKSEKSGSDFIIYTDHTAHQIDLRNYFIFSDGSTITVTAKSGQISNGIVALQENSGHTGVKEHEFSVTVKAEEGDATKSYELKIRQYDESQVTVVFKVNGEIKREKMVSRGGTVDATGVSLGDIEKGYEFDVWCLSGAEYDFDTPVSNDIELSARFKPINYRLIYKLGAGKNASDNPDKYNIESDFVLKNAIAPDGYEFDKWYVDENYIDTVSVLTGKTDDVTLYARYMLKNPVIKDFDAVGTEKYTIPKFDGSEPNVTVEAPAYAVTKEEYPYLLDYLIFHRIENAAITVSGLNGNEENGFYSTPAGKNKVSYSLLSSRNEKEIKIRFKFNAEPNKVSEGGTYEQIAFVEYAKKGGRNAAFNDFAIEHVKTAISAENGEQIYFALENGYRPSVKAGSIAEKVYTEMKKVLRQVVSDGMTDREKIMAISEWLVKYVAYDNAVYDKFIAGEEVGDCRCFGIEGAIIDKIAVCDGISKAFSALCAMEGIKAVQVTGTHNGVRHAWNKVYIDLDNDGKKEWTAVDCTSANTLLKIEEGKFVEIMNHAFIFASDDFLISKNGYVYDKEWEGKYVASKSFDVYSKTYYDNEAEHNFDVTNASDLEWVVALMRNEEIKNGKPTLIDFRTDKNMSLLVTSENRFEQAFVTALTKVGYTLDDINKRLSYIKYNVQDDEKIGVCIFMGAETAE